MKIGYLKYFYILLIVFILSMLGSYAFFSWGSGDNANTNVSFDVVADSVYIYYDAGSNITGADLYPTDDKSDGISKDITVKIDKVVSSKPVTFNLYLDLTDVPTALMNSSFKWALYDGDTQIKTGSITDTTTNCSKNSTKHITLLSGTISSVEEQKYTLYLWIDGNMTNPDTMMNQSFVVNLHADGTNATLVEGNSMSLISLDRNGGNNVNMTLQSLVYNFDSYAISSDGDNEPTNWTDMGCSDGSCDTSKKSIYQKNFNNVDLNYVNGVSYIWLKNTQGNVTKIEIGKNYNINLNNNGATSAGTTSVYGIYKDGFYKDSSYQEKYASTETIVVPTKTNYSFSGYYSGSVMVIDSKGKFVSGIENKYYDDITLTAKWVGDVYTISYNGNGGTGSMNSQTVNYGSSVTISSNGFSKKCYDFAGWTTKSDGTNDNYGWTGWKGTWSYTNGKYGIVDNKLNLYARWGAKTYTINYYSNGGTGTMDSQSVTADTSITLSTNKFVKEGYTFVGWTTKSDGTNDGYGWKANWSGTWKYDNGEYGISDNTLNLYAMWTQNYTISYNSNGGTGTMDSQIVYAGSSVTISANTFTRTGYTFAGWTTKSDGTNDNYGWTGWKGTWSYTNGNYGIANNKLVLYARWTANTYNLTYDCATNGGSTANSTTSVAYDSNVDLSKTCSKSGWTFVGWNTSSTATSAITSYKMPSNATTLYGIYKKEAITLTAKWNANGASLSTTADSSCTLAAVYNKATQATSCTVTAPTITRSGYTVVGYNTSASSTTNNSSYNTSSKVLTLTSSNTGKTWYAVSYKELSSNFYYYSGTAQTSTSAKCTVYNTTSVCTYTLPSVISSSSGPGSGAYYGVSTAKSSVSTTTTYNSSTSNYYAVYEGKFTATYKKGDNVDSVGSTSNSCNNKFVSNGSTYSGTSCSITLPVITPSAGFVAMGWYNSSGTKIGNASASATLTSNITLTAKARNLTASELSYDNSATGEDCSDVQCMIDRLDTLIEERYGG